MKLDEESLYFIIFFIFFGRCRWCRKLFGMIFVLEVFQQRMYELIEGFIGIEVVVDDFMVVDFGDIYAEVVCDRNRNFVVFFQQCLQYGVKFVVEKFQLCLEEVLLIGYYVIKSGLKVYFDKVYIILEMLCFIDVKSLFCFNGIIKYLFKFFFYVFGLRQLLIFVIFQVGFFQL